MVASFRRPCHACEERGTKWAAVALLRASRRARWALLSMRESFDGIKKIPHPEEAAERRLEGRTAFAQLDFRGNDKNPV